MTARFSIDSPDAAPTSWPSPEYERERATRWATLDWSIKSVRRHSPAREAAYAELRAQAGKTARAMIKQRARDYLKEPLQLDMFGHGVSSLAPRRLLECLAKVTVPACGNFGFGGEVPAINLRAAMLYARLASAKARQAARRAA